MVAGGTTSYYAMPLMADLLFQIEGSVFLISEFMVQIKPLKNYGAFLIPRASFYSQKLLATEQYLLHVPEVQTFAHICTFYLFVSLSTTLLFHSFWSFSFYIY